MIITYLNVEIDSTIEREIFNITPNGFKVTVKLKDYDYGDLVLNNVTEIHNRFDGNDSIAFESNIQSQGMTKDLKHILSVKIDLE